MSNTVTLIGNLTREPELKYTPSGAALVKFGIAVNRSFTKGSGERVEQTDFFNVVAWSQLAENIAESLTVGSRVIVTGRIETRSWETEEGQKRTAFEIKADEVGPSLRWETAAVTKAAKGGPGDWQSSDQSSQQSNEEVPAGT